MNSEQIFNLFTTILGTVLPLALGYVWGKYQTSKQNKVEQEENIKKQLDDLRECINKLENSNKVLLGDNIIRKCDRVLILKNVTKEEVDDIEQLVEPYLNLGGNHRAKALYEKVLNLERIEKR